MIAIPLLLLALAAGVYLLITVTREYLGGIFKLLAWVVIVFSFLSICFVVMRGLHHFKMSHDARRAAMNREERIIIKEHGGMSCCGDSSQMMSCCKMQGDSMVMDKAMCEKMMGKEACDKMYKERGQCIMSKEECAKVCGPHGMTDGKSPCCMGAGTAGGNECCKKKM